MKKLLLLLILSLFALHTSHSQEWFPVGAKFTWEWKLSSAPFEPWNVVSYVPEVYEVVKDTVVKGKLSKMLTRTGGNFNSWTLDTIFLFDSSGIVYYYPPIPNWMSEDKWSLLMNFNKNVGDTVLYKNMKGFGSFSDTIEYFNYVYSIDTINVNGLMVRCFEMHPNFEFAFNSFEICPCEYIIGCMPPAINGGDWGTGGIDYRKLRCYEDSFVGFYKNPSYNLNCDSAFSFFGVGFDNQLNPNSFQLFPNPAADKIKITISDFSFQVLSFKIFDIQGNLIKQTEINQSSQTIDVSDLKSGMYIYEIESEGRFHRDKLIIE